ncbi:hypothetical protein [Humibacter sp.]|uniref:hypothetical protein n=1 Tax=Humibacter sp. TaxID=1940291 RepID=UPI003F7DC853
MSPLAVVTHPGTVKPRDLRRWQKNEAQPVLACADCGVLIVDKLATADEVVTATAVEQRLHVGDREPVVMALPEPRQFRFGLCDACRQRRARAEEIIAKRPMLARSLGDKKYALSAIDAVLIVFDVLEQTGQEQLIDAKIDALRLALKNLSNAGGLARWSSRFAPVIKIGADPEQAGTHRWAHVTEAQLEVMRSDFAQYLRARTFRPEMVEPPEGENGHVALRGCLLCGVSRAPSTSRDDQPWGRLRSTQEAVLGGRGRPEKTYGYLCPACDKATDRIGGALGMNALEEAVYSFLEVSPKLGEFEFGRSRAEIIGLKAWCVTGQPPSTEAWAFLDGLGLEEIKKQLQKA